MKNNLTKKPEIWQQPKNVNEAYKFGAIVNYRGKLYISLVSKNAWEPSLAMWDECGQAYECGAYPS